MKSTLTIVLLSIFSVYALALAQELPSAAGLESDQVVSKIKEGPKTKYLPGSRAIPHIEISDSEFKQILNKARDKFIEVMKLEDKAPSIAEESPETDQTEEVIQEVSIQASSTLKDDANISVTPRTLSPPPKQIARQRMPKKSGLKIFTANLKYLRSPQMLQSEQTVTIPSGATTMATLKFGLEVPSPQKKVSARIDSFFLGPNDAIIELKNCVTWIIPTPYYSTKKIYGTTTTISCRAPNGKTFEVPFKAHIIDKETEYAGMVATLNLNGKAEASLFKFGQGMTNAFGNAMAAVALTKNVVPGSEDQKTVESENVTGNQRNFMLGKVAASAGDFLDWHVKFYTAMTPTLVVPPSTKIYLEVDGEASVPRIFFTSKAIKNLSRHKRLNTRSSYLNKDHFNEN